MPRGNIWIITRHRLFIFFLVYDDVCYTTPMLLYVFLEGRSTMVMMNSALHHVYCILIDIDELMISLMSAPGK